MNHMDDYGFYTGRQTGMEGFRDKLAQSERNTEQKIERTANDLLAGYRKRKEISEETAKKAFKLHCTSESFKQVIKEVKHLQRAQQIDSELIFCPCIFFAYQYQEKTKKAAAAQKPQKSSTVLSLYEPKQSWRPDLCKEINENNLVEMRNAKDGYIIEVPLERAEQQTTLLLATAIHDGSGRFSSWKTRLNINSSVKDIQSLLKVEVIYLPFWVAKFSMEKGFEYLSCDRFGKKAEINGQKLFDNVYV